LHPATPQSIANGAVVFRQSCAMCHGLGARGNGPLAPTLNPRPSDLVVHVPLHPDADLENWIANGFPGSAMPAFKDKLSDQERWDVLNYLKIVASNASATSSGNATSASGSPTASPRNAATPAAGLTPAVVSVAAPAPAATNPSSASPPSPPPPIPTTTPLPNGGLDQRRALGDLTAEIQIQPRVYEPAEFDITVSDAVGQPARDVRRVDLQVAMEGMDHGTRGVTATAVGPGRYRAQAMLLAMEGPWWLALRLERGDGQVDSTLFRFQVPRDRSTGAVSAMAERPTSPVQIEDVAVYPGEVTPNQIAVTAGHPVRLEIVYVDRPACGPTVLLPDQNLQTIVTPDGLAELPFVPRQSGPLRLSCAAAGLTVQRSGG
jgi:hypothetical protein